MDIDTLQAFVAVAENASFSRAAEQLFLTQPAISKRISALEAHLGTRLFDRIGHRINLTEAGLALLPRARRILTEVEDSRRAVANLSGEVAGALMLGTSHHIGLHRLPPYLRTFAARYPEVRLDLHFMDSEAACNAVEHGDLELGLVTLPLQPSPNLTITRIWPDPLTTVVSRDHVLAKRKSVTVAELARENAILPAHGTYTRELIEHAFTRLELTPNVAFSTNYLETIKMLVSVGLGWSVLPLNMCQEKELRVLRLPGLQLERQLGVVQHRDRTLSNAAGALIGLLVGG